MGMPVHRATQRLLDVAQNAGALAISGESWFRAADTTPCREHFLHSDNNVEIFKSYAYLWA